MLTLQLATLAGLALAAPPPPQIFDITYLTAAAANEGAVCLDGSPAAFYFFRGAKASSFYLHQQGGGWCSSDEDCFGRSKTALGSSKNYTQKIQENSGYFSNDPLVNPMMHDWSKLYIPYCDGGSQTGDLTEPVAVGGSHIFYRGHRILRALIPVVLAATGMGAASEVVLSGCSAGGLSTFLHADEWRAALPPAAKVAALPDSGFFLLVPRRPPPLAPFFPPLIPPTTAHCLPSLHRDYNYTQNMGYGQTMRWVFSRMNASGGVPAACVAANPADPARCIFAEHVAPTLRTPFFPMQSQYDSWQARNVLANASSAPAMNAFGALLRARLERSLLAPSPHNGVFLDACYHHCGNWGMTIDGQTTAAAFGAWWDALGTAGAKQEWVNSSAYPCTSCCAIA